MNPNIKIDFYGSTHGHFLDFISNVFIMQVEPDSFDVFSSTGAVHKVSKYFYSKKIIHNGHYYTTPDSIAADDIIIRITFDESDDQLFYMALVNLCHRAGDINLEKKLLNIPQYIRDDPILLRNDFFSKINERFVYINEYGKFKPLTNKMFEFPFECFYDFIKLSKKLNELAFFLNQTFFPDNRLYNLWKQFIIKNQGYQSIMLCDSILKNIFTGESHHIPTLQAYEEAYINYNITKIARMFEGTCFNSKYPTNTLDIYKEIQLHLQTLR